MIIENYIEDKLETLFSFLVKDYVEATGNTYIDYVPGSFLRLNLPALKPGLHLYGVDFNDVSKQFYTPLDLDLSTFPDIWEYSVDCIYKHRSASLKIGEYIPKLKAASGDVPVSSLAYLMYVTSWFGGKLDLSKNGMWLKLDKKQYGFDHRVVLKDGVYKKLPVDNVINAVECLSRSVQPTNAATDRLSAMLDSLCSTLPQYALQVTYLCLLLNRMSKDTQRSVLDKFSFNPVESIVVENTVWARALKLVNQSLDNPAKELWLMLRDHIVKSVFVKRFGSPDVHGRKTYTTKARLKHIEAIEELKHIKVAAPKVNEEAEGVMRILELQNLMGRSQ